MEHRSILLSIQCGTTSCIRHHVTKSSINILSLICFGRNDFPITSHIPGFVCDGILLLGIHSRKSNLSCSSVSLSSPESLLFSCLFPENITFSDKLSTQISLYLKTSVKFLTIISSAICFIDNIFNSFSGHRAIQEDEIIIYQDRKVEWNSNDLDYISNQIIKDNDHKQSETATTKITNKAKQQRQRSCQRAKLQQQRTHQRATQQRQIPHDRAKQNRQ